MAGGDLRAADAVAVVGFRALKDFHPARLADGLRRLTPAVEARPIELDLVPAGRADVSSLGYARAFEDPDFRARVVTHLGLRLRARERVAFPAVLGVTAADAVWSELERRLGRAVFEIPTLPPSVPGIRLHRVLTDALRRADGTLRLNIVATGAEHDGSRVTALRLRSGLRVQRHDADWVVVASGGFASGGLELRPDGTACETALGLPVAGVPSSGEPRFAPEYFARHAIDRAGVAVDGRLRPLDGVGRPVYENVLIAGATLAGCRPWREKSGDGISLTTGDAAAGEVLGR